VAAPDALRTEITNWINRAQDTVREYSQAVIGRDLVRDVLRACDEAISLIDTPAHFLAHRDAVEASVSRYANVIAEGQSRDAVALQSTAVSAALGNLQEALLTIGRASEKAQAMHLARAGDPV
jgi:hypothetical protein